MTSCQGYIRNSNGLKLQKQVLFKFTIKFRIWIRAFEFFSLFIIGLVVVMDVVIVVNMLCSML